jgi:N-acetylglucosamine PTS system EIIB component
MDKAQAIVAALGGKDNIIEIEPCITRLRTVLKDISLVDDAGLTAAGSFGTVKAGNVIQVVVGPIADDLSLDIEELLD